MQVADGVKGRHIGIIACKTSDQGISPPSPSDFHETYTRNCSDNGRGEGRWLMGRMKTYCHLADAQQHLVKSVEYQNSKTEVLANYSELPRKYAKHHLPLL